MAVTLNIALNDYYRWTTKVIGRGVIYYVGQLNNLNILSDSLTRNGTITQNEILSFVKAQVHCFALIVKSNDDCWAVVDHVRSYPIYYSGNDRDIVFSNDARKVQDYFNLIDVNKNSVSQFLLSGYVHGTRTLYESLSQLKAGQLIRVKLSDGTLTKQRYFRYLPKEPVTYPTEGELIEEFGFVLDQVFDSIVEQARDRLILVPLSGGLDSRLVLCKLLERKYSNLLTFSYGVRRNHEILQAKRIADKLGVRWMPIESRTGTLRKLYAHPDRSGYAKYADGLHMVPVYLDYEPIHYLAKTNKRDIDALVVNGYSGDFLFGGHIPEELVLFPSREKLVAGLTVKHCAHIQSDYLTTASNRVKSEIEDELKRENIADSVEIICGLYEYWDWQERQTKAVINGQRLYEYFGFDWALPLWHKDLMRFWRKVPLQYRLNQYLHIKYLKYYNYGGVFDQLRSVNEVWPKGWGWITFAGRIIEIVGGGQDKDRFFERMFYYSCFRNQLGFFGNKEYLHWYKRVRRPRVVPIAGIHHLRELGIALDEYL